MDLDPVVEIPEGALVVREVRLVQYEHPESGGIAIGVDGENGFDLIATLGILTLATQLLARDGEI